jgi:hypothetical protein
VICNIDLRRPHRRGPKRYDLCTTTTSLRLALVLLALVSATACGAGRPKPLETPTHVAALIRDRWGSTKGSRSFDYSCRRLDERGRLFTCLARDPTDTVTLASFDVVCDASRCTWTDYPSYVG